MKVARLFLATAAVEGLAGAALMVAPRLIMSLLLESSPPDPAAGVVARVYGAALIAVAAICFLARRDEHSVASRAIIAGVAIYHVATVLLLSVAGLGVGLAGPLLWPAVALHLVLTVWCVGARRRADTASVLSQYRRRMAPPRR